MSLFGALASGVSGLTSQSSAMGAISDNITNVSTIGFKNTRVSFQTLVTKQTSSTFYSAGGVQSRPRQATDVQGLLNASTSQTDLAISGRGFFVVNETGQPSINDQFLFSRSGSFFQDSEGFLKNTAGFYLQGWPTDASGAVIPANRNLSIANQNIISTDYLATINLNRVGGTAAATTNIGVGANLPASATAGDSEKTDVQFFDTLGNANTISFSYTKTERNNKWDLTVEPAPGTATATLEDSSGGVYDSIGQLEFSARPAEGTTVVIEGITYEVDTDASVVETLTLKSWDTTGNTTLAQDVADLVAEVQAQDSDFTSWNNRISISAASSNIVLFHDDGTRSISVDPTGLKDTNGSAVTDQTTAFTIRKQGLAYTDYRQITFTADPADGDTIDINGTTYTFATAEAAADGDTTVRRGVSLASTLADLEAAIEANDVNFPAGGTRVRLRENDSAALPNPTGANNTLVLYSLASGAFTVDASGLTVDPTEPDGTAFADVAAISADTTYAMNFDSKGLPSSFPVAELEIVGFSNGSADMDDAASNSPQVTLDFGTVGEANGFTQFGAEFTPVFITQNGSRFGTFAGVSISVDGLVTALFDNGEIRPIFQVPIATFVNPNQLESRTGNVWNSTEASGDYTLRVADNGPSGQTVQGALEASTVDIGEEFTNLIVVQRAYSASTKIIKTADEMLEELTRIK